MLQHQNKEMYEVLAVIRQHSKHKLGYRKAYSVFLSLMNLLGEINLLNEKVVGEQVRLALKPLPRLTDEERGRMIQSTTDQIMGRVPKRKERPSYDGIVLRACEHLQNGRVKAAYDAIKNIQQDLTKDHWDSLLAACVRGSREFRQSSFWQFRNLIPLW